MRCTINQAPGALTAHEIHQIMQAHDLDQLPPSTVQAPGGPAVRRPYRSSSGGPIDQPRLVLNRLRARLAAITNQTPAQMEPVQLLAYGPGQKYGLHHDQPQAGPAQQRFLETGGPRIISAVVALTDDHQGGGLLFPDLDQVVHPRVGYATWWHNDDRSARHQALTVTAGLRVVLVLFIRAGKYTGAADYELGTRSMAAGGS